MSAPRARVWSIVATLLATATLGCGFVQISAGGTHTCGRRTDGSVWC